MLGAPVRGSTAYISPAQLGAILGAMAAPHPLRLEVTGVAPTTATELLDRSTHRAMQPGDLIVGQRVRRTVGGKPGSIQGVVGEEVA